MDRSMARLGPVHNLSGILGRMEEPQRSLRAQFALSGTI